MQKRDSVLGSATRMGISISHQPPGSIIPLFETLHKPSAATAGRHISQAGGCRGGYVETVWQHSSASFQGSRYVCRGKLSLRRSQNCPLANTIKGQMHRTSPTQTHHLPLCWDLYFFPLDADCCCCCSQIRYSGWFYLCVHTLMKLTCSRTSMEQTQGPADTLGTPDT